MGRVTHIVSVKLPASPVSVATELTAEFISLVHKCKKPDGSGYIRSITGGPDMSIEGLQKGFTHVFVVEFDSVEDRDYYVQKDSAHAAFAARIVAALEGGLDGAVVLDFEH